MIDRASSQPASLTLDVQDKVNIANHVSPNGRYYIRCHDGIEFYEAVNETGEYEKGEIVLKRKLWKIPLNTANIPF